MVGWNVLAKTVSIVSCLLHQYIYGVYIKLCKIVLCIYISVQYGGTSFFPFGTVLYSIRSICVGNVKSILGQQNVSIVISNSFGEINVLGMVEILTCGDPYVMYRASASV